MPASLKVLFVTSELFPLIKTGGLADISGSLPLALRGKGADVRVLLPGYPAVLRKLPDATKLAKIKNISAEAGQVNLLEATLPDSDLPLLIIDCPKLYDRDGGPYLSPEGTDWPDNVLRFGVLSQVGALLASANSPLKWRPDVVHSNDWQSALIPALLHFYFSGVPHARSVLSIHNLAFQGNFGAEWVPRLGLPAASYAMDGVEFYGHFSFLKAGIYYADEVTTVSKTYAEEIQTAEFGYGMQGLLHARRANLSGIVNAIGNDWDPAHDAYLHQNFDHNSLQKKFVNKQALQQELGLQTGSLPLLCMVSRLTYQKGVDLLLDCARELVHSGVQLAVLGSGEAQFETQLHELAEWRPGLVSAVFGYNEGLAHRMIAGGDIFLMPSRFEPCGLSQMYGMAYGTPSVVRRTGGLADTVIDTNAESLLNGTATGFVFEHETAADFLLAVQRALASFQTNDVWNTIQQNGMAQNFGWDKAAEDYLDVYRKTLAAKGRAA